MFCGLRGNVFPRLDTFEKLDNVGMLEMPGRKASKSSRLCPSAQFKPRLHDVGSEPGSLSRPTTFSRKAAAVVFTDGKPGLA